MLFGNLGADPELKTLPGGQTVLSLRLATTESYLDSNRVRQERTEWHSVKVWGKRGEALAQFLSKGSRVFIEGGIRTSSYEDREGVKRYRTDIVASNVILSGGGTRSNNQPNDDAREYDYQRGSDDRGDDDIPF